MARILSIAAFILIWALAAALAHSAMLPAPLAVATTIVNETRAGELPFEMACTLARVAVSFAIALILGSAAGYAMGHWKAVDRYADPWLVALINLPALVTIIFAYIWIGLNDTAAMAAVSFRPIQI